ncbi:hypothetical protein K2173_023074 [Erythroxylum novogranatense]|uniref:Transmembrane protein n=1 Tax=Erythroxylum novogranatense TaxID=1862640 RepID=A0AAV8T9R3_9ROSI|nr:hypothetical protein K2173_023074 [Erythroxylum novogranatense]
MDREQEEMQFLGLFGTYTESFKIIFTWRKIFGQITLALIFPLTLIFLAQMEISDILFSKIMRNEIQLEHTRAGTARYEKLSDMISSEMAYLWLFKFAYLIILFVLSLLSTAAVVYTIACIYTGRDVTFKKVISVVPGVWKRLMITFLSIFFCFLAYNFVAVVVLILWAVLIGPTKSGISVFYILLLFYSVVLVYMAIVWQLASVVSVLEDACGFKAMIKSRALIKGKMWMATVVFLKLSLSSAAIRIIFQKLVVRGGSLGMVNRVSFGIICFLLIIKLFLFQLVIQTVIYFICKSYHHENIDKSALSDHLEVYMGEYVPLKSKDVQLEHFEV